VHSGIKGCQDAVDLRTVSACQHDNIAWSFPNHSFQEIWAGMDLQLPGRGVLFPGVEPGDPAHVGRYIQAQRRIDVDLFRHAFVHFLLHQCRVKVTGIKRNELYTVHGHVY
jgi:hypothetical protein